MIHIPSNDSVITDRDRVVIEIIQQMTARPAVINLTTNGEGPCARELGLYDLLDLLCAEFDYPKQQVNITTCNLVESHNEYNIIIDPQMIYLDQARSQVSLLNNKDFANIKHFGNFIGHGNIHRLHLASYLYNNYQDKTLATYHCQVTEPYHRPFIAVEDMMFNGYTNHEIDDAVNLIRNSPLVLDNIDTYPILLPATLNILKLYSKFFVEVANLTYFSGNTFYIDEKLWRPMLAKTPFIAQGPQNVLSNLKKLGFKTFDQFWDEGYQEDPSSHQPREIIKVLNRLAKLTTVELEDMYNEMLPILEHNQQRALEIKRHEFIL